MRDLTAAIVCLLLLTGCRQQVYDFEPPSDVARGGTNEVEPSAAEGNVGSAKSHASPATDAWPNLFGPFHTSVAGESPPLREWTANGPPLRWEAAIGAGYSSPVARDNRLIVFYREADEEVLECRAANTGQSIWQLRRPTTYKCKYRYSDGPYSSPIIDGESVYAISAEGIMRCVDAVTGMPRWEKSLWDEFGMEENLFAVAGSPLLWRDRLIFNAGGTNGDAGIVAIDKRSGKTMWTATDHRAGYATPIAATIHGQDYVFVVTFEGLVALDPNDGRVFWEIRQRPTKPDSINATSPLVDVDLVLMVTGPGPGAMCVRVLPNGEYAEVWRDRRVLDSQFNNLALVNGFVYGYTTSRQGGADFRCVELATGELRWQWNSALERGSSLVVGQRLLLLGEHGHLAMLDVNSNKAAPRCITDHQVLEGPCYSAPAFHRGMLFVRNERWIRCYEVTAKND